MSIRDYTEFEENAVGIDPPGCGCTDCICGDSIPLDYSWTLSELARQAVRGRPLINRSSRPLVLDLATPAIHVVPEGYPDRWRFSTEEVTPVAKWPEVQS